MATSEDFVIILDKTQAEQRTFFQQNVSDQFRGWTIANNKPNPSYFDPWDNPDASEDNYFRIDPNYQSQSIQRTFFQQNVSEQFRGWTIANNKPNPQFFIYKVLLPIAKNNIETYTKGWTLANGANNENSNSWKITSYLSVLFTTSNVIEADDQWVTLFFGREENKGTGLPTPISAQIILFDRNGTFNASDMNTVSVTPTEYNNGTGGGTDLIEIRYIKHAPASVENQPTDTYNGISIVNLNVIEIKARINNTSNGTVNVIGAINVDFDNKIYYADSTTTINSIDYQHNFNIYQT